MTVTQLVRNEPGYKPQQFHSFFLKLLASCLSFEKTKHRNRQTTEQVLHTLGGFPMTVSDSVIWNGIQTIRTSNKLSGDADGTTFEECYSKRG